MHFCGHGFPRVSLWSVNGMSLSFPKREKRQYLMFPKNEAQTSHHVEHAYLCTVGLYWSSQAKLDAMYSLGCHVVLYICHSQWEWVSIFRFPKCNPHESERVKQIDGRGVIIPQSSHSPSHNHIFASLPEDWDWAAGQHAYSLLSLYCLGHSFSFL